MGLLEESRVVKSIGLPKNEDVFKPTEVLSSALQFLKSQKYGPYGGSFFNGVSFSQAKNGRAVIQTMISLDSCISVAR